MSSTKRAARAAVALASIMWSWIAHAADVQPWSVSKSSGEVWTVTSGAQQASLSQQSELKAGDTIRTGRNGRVLLTRGEESILIAPNSAIAIPVQAGEGVQTTILQQAGSILLDVEKKNVKHFEVETPYLAAVVKGTQFRITVNATGTSVNVIRGQVQVSDFKSGQIAQVLPGQAATSFASGRNGLALSGSGTFTPIEQGRPRTPSIERLMVPKNGLGAPRNAANGMQVRTVGEIRAATSAGLTAPTVASLPSATSVTAMKPAASLRAAGNPGNALRIGNPIGDVRLNFNKVTNGLARGTTAATPAGRGAASAETTIWNARDGKATAAGLNGQGNVSESNGMPASVAAVVGPAVSNANANATSSDASGAPTTSNGNSNNGNSGAVGNAYGTRARAGNASDDDSRGNNGNHGNGNNGNGRGNGKN